MTNSDRDNIANAHFAFGKSATEISKEMGYTHGGVMNVINTLSLVKADKTEELAEKIIGRTYGENMVMWAYARCGKVAPAVITETFTRLHAKKNAMRGGQTEQLVIEEHKDESDIKAALADIAAKLDTDKLYNIIYHAVYEAVKKAWAE